MTHVLVRNGDNYLAGVVTDATADRVLVTFYGDASPHWVPQDLVRRLDS